MGLLQLFGAYGGIIYCEEILRCFFVTFAFVSLCLCGRWSMLRTSSLKLPHLRLYWRCSRELRCCGCHLLYCVRMGDVGVPASRLVSWKKSRDALGMPRSSTLRTLVIKHRTHHNEWCRSRLMCVWYDFVFIENLERLWVWLSTEVWRVLSDVTLSFGTGVRCLGGKSHTMLQ